MKPDAFWLAVMTSVIWGFVPILEKIGLAKTTPLTGLFFRSFGVILGMVVLYFFYLKPDEIRAIDLRSALFVMAGGFLASFVAQVLFYTALKTGDVSRIVPISGSYPLIAFILGVLILGEQVTVPKMIGALLIIGGVWLIK